jgi:hypothetical protein
MKKMILTVATILTVGLVNAQWTKKTVNNGLDEPYKICYTATNNGGYLKLEGGESKVSFYVSGGYYCEDSPLVNISFLVNNEWIKHSVWGNRSSDHETVFLTFDLENEVFLKDFLNATSVKLRVNETYCENEVYQFNMAGSTSAFNFLNK